MKVILIEDDGKETEYEDFILLGLKDGKRQRVLNEVALLDMCIAKEWLQERITNAINRK